jgi:uncharacterized protein (DUF302 family)
MYGIEFLKKTITMNAYFTKMTDMAFDEAIEHVTAILKEHGFGVLTQIDVKDTMKQKIDKEFRPYRILGACNPAFAYQALQADNKAGIIMPCNVIVQEHMDGKVEITITNPDAAVGILKSKALEDFACDVTKELRKVFRKI